MPGGPQLRPPSRWASSFVARDCISCISALSAGDLACERGGGWVFVVCVGGGGGAGEGERGWAWMGGRGAPSTSNSRCLEPACLPVSLPSSGLLASAEAFRLCACIHRACCCCCWGQVPEEQVRDVSVSVTSRLMRDKTCACCLASHPPADCLSAHKHTCSRARTRAHTRTCVAASVCSSCSYSCPGCTRN